MTTRPRLERPWWLLPLGRLDPRWWVGFAAALFVGDYLAGPDPMFPLLYCLPVFGAAWYSGLATSTTLALVLPAVHMVLLAGVWHAADFVTILATIFRGVIVALLALWFGRFAEHERDMQQHVKTLEGLLPICSFCKNIRNDDGEWERIEGYITHHSGAQFSHGLCPSCQVTYYPEVATMTGMREEAHRHG